MIRVKVKDHRGQKICFEVPDPRDELEEALREKYGPKAEIRFFHPKRQAASRAKSKRLAE